MRIKCKDDYKHIINTLVKEGNDVVGTYEKTGETVKSILFDTKTIQDMFEIKDEFVREFVHAISTFEEKQVGPYITEKYFHLIPSVKKAVKQLITDNVETRRCVVQFPEEHCFQSIQFLLRENTINVVCYMRSCDAIKNLPYDLWLCSFLADVFSRSINETLGISPYKHYMITMMFGSLHVYQEDVK